MEERSINTPDKQDPYVRYYDGPHAYYNREGRRMVSATQWIKSYFSAFDAKEQSIKQAAKYGATPNFWEYVWEKHKDAAAKRGSRDHLRKEKLALEGKIDAPEYYLEDLPVYDSKKLRWPLHEGSYPELLLSIPSWGLCGQADQVWLCGGLAWVDDYKTTKDIGRTYRNAKPPFNMLPDSSFGKFALQLNFLAAIIKEMHGYRIQQMRVSLIGNGREEKMVEVPDIVDKVLKEMEYTGKQWAKQRAVWS